MADRAGIQAVAELLRSGHQRRQAVRPQDLPCRGSAAAPRIRRMGEGGTRESEAHIEADVVAEPCRSDPSDIRPEIGGTDPCGIVRVDFTRRDVLSVDEHAAPTAGH